MPSKNRYLLVHGHFYQPPRENPWIESVETQDSAAPYHDWNERITAECYARNGASRILNKQNEILRIVNNYAQISFNFGPTLLSWLEEHAELAYRDIREADRLSIQRFSGHGSALAQVYNHIILPLASRRDKELQVRWGIADFEHRFSRKPEGMWLAETAVDTESLEVLAAHGILFTVLAPHQCAAVRPLTQRAEWQATTASSTDPRRAYRVLLPSGRSITVFFYDGPRSRAIAFERLLDSGENFARALVSGFSSTSPAEPELVHVATDGESYGHHHRFGEMALSYALAYTEEQGLATLTNYGEFLERFPPAWEAKIVEASSWSCAHGIERWHSNCGCNGGKPGWNQLWRAPLRDALDLLRDHVTALAAQVGATLFKDWNGACDRYIHVILNRPQASQFLLREQARILNRAEEVQAFQLLELVRHAQLMYTSCGWFFDDIAGIETVQVIAYAARVLELAQALFGEEGRALEAPFLEILQNAESNVPTEGTGRDIYVRNARAHQVGLEQVAAHYAISSVFRNYPEHARVFAFHIERLGEEVQSSGRGRLLTGKLSVRSTLTLESERLYYAVLHFGDQNIAARVRRRTSLEDTAHARFREKARTAMLAADLPAILRLFDREFGEESYTIHSLFKDEQRRVVKDILNSAVAEAEDSLVRLYADHAALLHFLSTSEAPRPSALALAANFAVNTMLRRALEATPIDHAQIEATLALAAQDKVAFDEQPLSFLADRRMTEAMLEVAAHPNSGECLAAATATALALQLLPFAVDIWQAQNIYYAMALSLTQNSSRQDSKPRIPEPGLFKALGRALAIAFNQPTPD